MKILAPEISTGTRISRNHHRKQQIRRCIYTISKRQINKKRGYKVTDKDATYRVNILKKVTVEDCLDFVESQENI